MFNAREPSSWDSSPKSEHNLPKAASCVTVEDSKGQWEAAMEYAVDRSGNVFHFARLDPREQGEYEILVDDPGADVLVEDKWDPAHNSRGRHVELREGSMLIVKTGTFLGRAGIRAKLKKAYKGRIVSLVRNGDFEVGIPGYAPRGWWFRHYSTGDPSYVYLSDESPAEGKHCMKLVRAVHKARAYSQSIKIAKPGRYVFRFKAKATCKGASINTSWSRQSLVVRVEPSEEWREYRVERDMTPHDACIHCLFDKAEGPNQVLWVDDMEFGRVAE